MAIWQHRKRVLGIFSPRMRRDTAIKELPVKNLTPPFAPATSISYKTDALLLPRRLLDIFDVFVLLRCKTLWPWVFRVQCFTCPTHISIIIILLLSVTELRVLNIWSHFRYLKQSLRMRRVTWPLTGGKIVHPNLSIHFVTFRALRRRLSHVIDEK